jgi:hypothetical protein
MKSDLRESHLPSKLDVSVKSKKTKKSVHSQNNFLESEVKPKLEDIVAKKSKKEYQFSPKEEDLQEGLDSQRDRQMLESFNETLFTKELYSMDSLAVYLRKNPFDFGLSSKFFFNLDKYRKTQEGPEVRRGCLYSLANCNVDSFSDDPGFEENFGVPEIDIARKRGFSHNNMFNVHRISKKKRFSIEEEETNRITKYFNKEIKQKQSNKNRNLLFDLKMNFKELEFKHGNDIGRVTREVLVPTVPGLHTTPQLRNPFPEDRVRSGPQAPVPRPFARPQLFP